MHPVSPLPTAAKATRVATVTPDHSSCSTSSTQASRLENCLFAIQLLTRGCKDVQQQEQFAAAAAGMPELTALHNTMQQISHARVLSEQEAETQVLDTARATRQAELWKARATAAQEKCNALQEHVAQVTARAERLSQERKILKQAYRQMALFNTRTAATNQYVAAAIAAHEQQLRANSGREEGIFDDSNVEAFDEEDEECKAECERAVQACIEKAAVTPEKKQGSMGAFGGGNGRNGLGFGMKQYAMKHYAKKKEEEVAPPKLVPSSSPKPYEPVLFCASFDSSVESSGKKSTRQRIGSKRQQRQQHHLLNLEGAPESDTDPRILRPRSPPSNMVSFSTAATEDLSYLPSPVLTDTEWELDDPNCYRSLAIPVVELR